MPPIQFIDLHSHLLPGVDDGCRSVDESLACVGTLIAHGFSGTVCTPHMAMSYYWENHPAKVVEAVAALQGKLDDVDLDYRLWPGGEVRIAEDTLAWLHQFGVPTLGPGRGVLIDYWGSQWPAYADQLIEHLLEEDYRPILAHPERMDLADAAWDAVLERLQQRGVRLQGNLRCIAGGEGPRVGERAVSLLRDNRYYAVATDMHGTPDLPDRLAGLATIEQVAGADRLQQLLAGAPREVLAATQ